VQTNGGSTALLIFVLIVKIDVVTLLVDLLLLRAGLPTVTDAGRRHWWFGASLVLVQLWGAFALALHIFGGSARQSPPP
jgi:hypothetical protein